MSLKELRNKQKYKNENMNNSAEFDKYSSAQSDRLHNRNSEIIRELEDAKIGEINENFIIQFCAT